MYLRILKIALLVSLCSSLRAEIILPAVLSNNMVLQHNSEVKLWGWKTTRPNGESITILFKQFLPEVPFLDRMGYTFPNCVFTMVITSLLEGKGKYADKVLAIGSFNFRTGPVFNTGAIGICILFMILYILFQ